MRRLCFGLAALLAFSASAQSAPAPEQVKIGIGYGLAFLPFYICEDLKLVEKYAKASHLDIKASYTRFLGSGPVQEAIGSGAIDMGPFGAAPFLAAWEQQKDSPQQAVIVSGITTMPLTLLSDRPNVASISDLGPTDRIAMPSLTAPQMFVLQMQAAKSFSKSDHFDDQVVALPPADALTALINGAGMVTADFASPPYTELALRDGKVHPVLNSADVFGGKGSFLMLGATRAYVDAHPEVPDAIDKAIDEAARIIHNDPRRAAQIYLTHEPSEALSGSVLEMVLREIKDDFGTGIYGVKAYSDFMAQQGVLKEPPRSWRYIVAPSMMNWPRS
jgi:NitT/TauT family transport system substrate-binding protein